MIEPNNDQSNQLCEQDEDILLLALVISHIPYKTTEVVQEAYIDALLEIQFLTTEEKRSRLDEIKSMLGRLRQSE